MKKARVFLITTHYMGVLYIEELLRAGDEIVGVAAWPDTAGWYVPLEYDVRTKALQNYLPLYEPDPKKLNSEKFLNVIRGLKPDFIVSGYYPKLFGDERNYITLHWLDAGADTGDVIAQASVEILPEDTGFTCGHRLTEAAAAAFRDNWPLIKAGNAPRARQDESKASVFNFDWSIARIDWSKSALEVRNLVRSISKPLSGAWTTAGGKKMFVWKVQAVERGSEVHDTPLQPGTVVSMDGVTLRPIDMLGRLAKNVRVVLG